MALSWLDAAGLPWTEELACVHSVDAASRETLRSMLRGGIQAPLTSSMGRLFDAVAALIGIRQVVNYEAQAAIELEACVDPDETGKYRLAIEGGELDPAPALAALVRDIRRGVPAGVLSARFHNGLAEGVVEVCTTARERTGLDSVVLSGGVWQNLILFRRTAAGLRERGFRVLAHQRVPANDGGVALGQAVIAMHQLGVAESINSREDVEAA
jgi:hydrogenase maturation protein HypF